MTSNDYMWAWLVYIAGASAILLVLWLWLRKLPWVELRQLVLLVFAVALFVPWYTELDQDYLSPAWMVMIGDIFTKSPEEGWRAGGVLLVALTSAIFLSALVYTFLWWRSRRDSGAESSL